MGYKPSTKQGQNRNTIIKQCNLAATLAISLDISKGQLNYPYWHLDMNAGCGWNHEADCAGSPLVFVGQASRKSRVFNALFCDNNSEAIGELVGRLAGESVPLGSFANTFSGSNAEGLDCFAAAIRKHENPKYAFGTCYCDPNGFTEKTIPVSKLRAFSIEFPRIDLIININASLFARVQGCKEKGKKGFTDWPTPLDLLKSLNRNCWMVSSPPAGGGANPTERFFLAVGRDMDTNAKRYRNFYRIESQQGQEIVNFPFQHIPEEQGMLFNIF